MAGSSKTTTDLKEIRTWAEARGGRPVTVKGTGTKDEAGVLRIDFPGGASDDRFEELSWEEWYEKFNEKKLALNRSARRLYTTRALQRHAFLFRTAKQIRRMFKCSA